MYLYLGSDRPALKYLNRHVVKRIAAKWYDIGLELMEIEDQENLTTMKVQYAASIVEGSNQMLRFWLDRQPHASWNQLIEALKANHIGFYSLAVDIERMLYPEGMYVDK